MALGAALLFLLHPAGHGRGEEALGKPSGQASTPDHPSETHAMAEEVQQAVNAIRREKGLSALSSDPRLNRLARDYSRRMARENFFAHSDPAGRTLVDRLRDSEIGYRAAGENIFKSWNVPRPVEAAVQGWMESPGHRSNILNPEYTESGVGVWREGESYFFTQVFLRPEGQP